jgi:hypothetical protein
MKQLRFTTTEPRGMFSMIDTIDTELLVTIDNIGTLSEYKPKGSGAYIHGDAEELAGFDIPIFLDGDYEQLDLPIEEQDILMILPSGNYQCVADLSYKTMFADEADKYLLTLKV